MCRGDSGPELAADLYTDGKIPGFNELLLTKPFRRTDIVKAIQDTLAA
jgi:hypothetical protein